MYTRAKGVMIISRANPHLCLSKHTVESEFSYEETKYDFKKWRVGG